jgi:hypothetical protein
MPEAPLDWVVPTTVVPGAGVMPRLAAGVWLVAVVAGAPVELVLWAWVWAYTEVANRPAIKVASSLFMVILLVRLWWGRYRSADAFLLIRAARIGLRLY